MENKEPNFKIHDFVVGMRLKLYNSKPDQEFLLVQLDKRREMQLVVVSEAGLLWDNAYSIHISDVEKILHDPRTKDDPNPNLIQNKTVGWYGNEVSRDTIENMNEKEFNEYFKTGVFQKSDGNWSIPDSYIKPGVKFKTTNGSIWMILHKMNYDLIKTECLYPTSSYAYPGRVDTKPISTVCRFLRQNGPEWSWTQDTSIKPYSVNPVKLPDPNTASNTSNDEVTEPETPQIELEQLRFKGKQWCSKEIGSHCCPSETQIENKKFCKHCGKWL